MRWLVVLAGLAGCTQPASKAEQSGTTLERAAIAAGVVHDPADVDITGLYARDTDRLCVVPMAAGYRIGAASDYGDGQGCSASGTLARTGEALRIAFDSAPGCTFNARLDGLRIIFPGQLPTACERVCSDRASFAALEVDLLSNAPSEATTLRDRRGRNLCVG